MLSVVRHQMIWYVAASVFAGILICLALMAPEDIGTHITSTITSVTALLVYFSPLVFTRFKTRSLFITIPVNRSFKSLCVIIYTTVIIPLIVVIPAAIVITSTATILSLPVGSLTGYIRLIDSLGIGCWIMCQSQYLVTALITLLVVFCCRSNVTAKAIGAVIGYILLIGLIGGIFGAISALNNQDKIELMASQFNQSHEISPGTILSILPGFHQLIFILGIAQTILTIILLVISYKKIVNLQA